MLIRSVRLHFLSIALLLSAAAVADPEGGLAGLSLEAAIAEISTSGVRVFYSSDLVRPSMRVTAEPSASDSVEKLARILAPHGLVLRAGLNDSWLVVRGTPREPATEAEPPERGAAPTRADLVPVPRPIEQVVVSASRYEIRGAQTPSIQIIGSLDLEHSPDLGDDALRSVARLPGVAAGSFSARANIRGGDIHETLVRLDGLSLYDPFHLKDFQGVFSLIDPKIVREIDVYTGGLPARFGDSLSGVIDVATASAPEDRYHELGVSFFNTSLLSAGRFADDRGEWLASARRSNLDVLYDRFSDQPERPRYTDLFAKLGFDIGTRTSLTGNVLRATDRIELADDVDREEQATARQTDTYAWLRLDHRLGGRTSGTTLLAHTTIDSRRSGTSQKSGISEGSLLDVRSFAIDTLRSDWLRIVGSRSMLEFGGEAIRMQGRYDYRDEVAFDLIFDIDGAPSRTARQRSIGLRPSGRQHMVYANLRTDYTTRLSAEIGFHWTGQIVDGAAARTFGPRLGIRYAVSNRTAIRASWGRFFQHQRINELQVSDGITGLYAPQESEHYVVGLDRQLGGDASIRVELYSKLMSRLRPRFENLLNTRVLLPELKPDRVRIAPDSARARGIEVSLEGLAGAFGWWGSLSLARVYDRIGGRSVPRSWDQHYALSAGFDLALARWTLSAGLEYRAGWPTTAVSLDADAAFPTAVATDRNDMRMGAFGSLDMRLSRPFRFDQSTLTVFVEVVNLTDRRNPCCREYEIGDEEDLGRLVVDDLYHLPRIPSIGFSWAF